MKYCVIATQLCEFLVKTKDFNKTRNWKKKRKSISCVNENFWAASQQN
jgi:hypothetical protein